MASRKVEVAIVGDAKSLERAFSRAGKSAGQFGKEMSGFHKVGTAVAKGFAAAAVGITAIAAVGAEQISQQAKVTAQTNTILKNLGSTAGVTTGQVERLASAIQAQTGAEDDNIQAASNIILRYGLITGKGKEADAQLSRLTRTSLDLSVATGKDLTASTMALGRAMADPTKAAGALRRAGIILTSQQKDQIKAMVDSGHTAEAQAKVLQLVEGRVKGSAAAFGNTLPGQVEKAKRSFEDLAQNALATLAPAFSKLMPVVVSALKAIAPLVATAASAIADLANQLISSPAFQDFARSLKDIATQGIQILTRALQALAPIVLAIAVPVAALASAILNSRVAIVALTSALAAFMAVKAADRIRDIVTEVRALSIVGSTATGVRALGSSLAVLATGFSNLSAKSVGLAPGLTAAQAGLSRVKVAGGLARAGLSGLGSTISSALGGPIGIATVAVTGLAMVIGGDLISSFTRSKDPAQRYADAMNNVADATNKAKDSLSGLSQAMLDTAGAQDRTRETTANVVRIEGELANMRRNGLAGTEAYKQKERELTQARRDNSQAILDQHRNEDALKSKQAEVRGSIGSLVTGLQSATGAYGQQNAAMKLAVAAGTMSKDSYQAWLQVANQKIMGSQEMQNFRTKVNDVADSIRAQGTPQAIALANALDKAGKTRDPAALATYLGKIVTMTGGTKGDVKKLIDDMNRAFGNAGNTKASTVWQQSILQGLGTVGSTLSGIVAQFQNLISLGGKTVKAPKVQKEVLGAGAFKGPNAMGWFFQQRSAAAGAVGNLSAAARAGFMANDPEAKALNDRVKAQDKVHSQLQKQQLQERIDSAQTDEEKQQAISDMEDFNIAEAQRGVDERAQKYQDDIDNLGAQFNRGEISATTFKDKLGELLGPNAGDLYGSQFASSWGDAFNAVMDPITALIQQNMGSITGQQGVEGPAAEQPVESTAVKDWESRRDKFKAALASAKKGKGGLTAEDRQKLKHDYGADDLAEWLKENPKPKMARGGIVTASTDVTIGEAGPEAIIPLSSPKAKEMLSGAGARGGGNINLVFNGVMNAKDAARMLRPELDRLVRLAV